VINITALAHEEGYVQGQRMTAMRDLLRDWRRWSLAERVVAILMLASAVLVQIPLVL
jgi:hypothetical protein